MAVNRYSVILMRDDQSVRHYHFRSLWLRLLIFSILFILAASILFGYVSVKLWLKTNHLNDRITLQNVELQKKQVRLNRLENIEKVVAYRDPDQLEKLITGQLTDLYNPDAPPKVQLRDYYDTIDSEGFSIENISAKPLNKKALNLRFDLKNTQDDAMVRGKADVSLLTNNARVIEHTLSPNNQIFQIKHYKTFNSTIHLPDGTSTEDIFALRIIISGPQGKIYFGKTYRLDDIIP